MSSRAVQFNVAGLFGEFDHQVNFPEDDNFAIIHGPNGVGKTRFLEVIRALCSLDTNLLESLPYDEASIAYSDSSRLTSSKGGDEGGLTLSILTDGRHEEWRPPAAMAPGAVSHAGGSEWVYERSGFWIDQNDGETLSESEFRSRYGGSPTEEPPQVFAKFAAEHPVHLITTQRLSSTPQPRQRPGIRNQHFRRRAAGASTVSWYAADVVDQLESALTQNSRRSAALDRTFPQRLLQYVAPRSATENTVRERYSTQNQQRERLARLSLIGSEADFDLPIQALEEWQLTVLSLYLDDTEAKLATFDDVLTRAELFEEIVNRRFLRKRIAVNAEDGITIVTTGSGSHITPEDLSSGEQHELIMFYDMLFRVPPGALVLIDEPEISLHVGWQRQFLDDMERVSNVAGTRLLVATHSPQIIGRWWSRTTVIGEIEAEDAEQ
ncbi:MAG: ATP-binding protein [Cellulomonas sp.]|nr:ATP-binding protein [Cellulomonas sp.]